MEPDGTGSLPEIAMEARRLMGTFDAVPWPQMNAFFYMHAYEEFHLLLEQLLDALERECPDS